MRPHTRARAPTHTHARARATATYQLLNSLGLGCADGVLGREQGGLGVIVALHLQGGRRGRRGGVDAGATNAKGIRSRWGFALRYPPVTSHIGPCSQAHKQRSNLNISPVPPTSARHSAYSCVVSTRTTPLLACSASSPTAVTALPCEAQLRRATQATP